MLIMSKGALSLGQAETYYQEKYSQDDYYSESHRVRGRWYGQGAAALGLGAEVSEEQFRAVLRGLDPRTADVLVSAAAGRSERRAGWDATFNAPKSVSIQALVGRDERLSQAHGTAVQTGAWRDRALCTGAPAPRAGMGHHRQHGRCRLRPHRGAPFGERPRT